MKQKLCSAPVLAFPNFERDYVLETDTSILGLGAVLAQQLEDGKLHPVSLCQLSPQLSREELCHHRSRDTRSGVGHNVTIYTDHSAVEAVLETSSNPTLPDSMPGGGSVRMEWG